MVYKSTIKSKQTGTGAKSNCLIIYKFLCKYVCINVYIYRKSISHKQCIYVGNAQSYSEQAKTDYRMPVKCGEEKDTHLTHDIHRLVW